MAITRYVESMLEKVPALQEQGSALKQALHEAILKGGEPTRRVADLLHGTWLGHPLHPVLTDITIGAWGLSALFDVVAAFKDSAFAEEMADRLVAVGTYSAIPTALTGLTDYSGIQKPAVSSATLHALLNDVNIVLYALSLRDRRRGNRGRGVLLSTLALLLSAASAWLGGHLVYRHNVGTDHSPSPDGPANWTPVLDAAALEAGQPQRVSVDEQPVLLYRQAGTVYAIGAVCSHAGGPLEEGMFDGPFVQCPWHDSVFDLRDGCVKHGPATHPQPRYEARIQDGQVEVRLQAV